MLLNPPAYRGLSEPFLAALAGLVDEPGGNWWRDVLAHPDLILAVRREALDVYHRGASLFRVRFVRGRVHADTHAKYLVRQVQTRIPLEENGSFALGPKPLLWPAYAGPQTLAEMIKAAGSLVGVEKSGVHALVRASANVVDVEIALSGENPPDDEDAQAAATDAEPALLSQGGKPRQDRIDVASLEERGHSQQAWLVFHEAKDYTNAALRAGEKRSPAIKVQMGRYRGSIGQNEGGLVYSYPFVCQALLRLDRLRRGVRTDDPAWAGREQPLLDPLIADVAEGRRSLRVDTEPRLVVFGFDADQRDGAWARERERLRSQFGLRVYAVGDPAAAKVAAAFRRPADVPLVPPPPPEPPPPDRIPLPQGAPDALCLYFAPGGSRRPVYLCNPGETALTDLRMSSVGFTLSSTPSMNLDTGTAVWTGAELPPRCALRVDDYDIFTDGDRLTPYAVTANRADGSALRAGTIIGKGGPDRAFVPLKPEPEPVPETTPIPPSAQ